MFGIDTTTEEGRAQFKKEWETLSQIAPELLSKEDMVYPHEMPAKISNEPHFKRVWQFYREYMFKLRVAGYNQQGDISDEDLKAFKRFTSMSSQPVFSTYLYAKLGKLPHLQNDADFQATARVMEKLGLDHINIDRKSAQPYEEQFWEQFDLIQNLNEEEMRQELPYFVTDLSNKAKVEALLAQEKDLHLANEQSQKLNA